MSPDSPATAFGGHRRITAIDGLRAIAVLAVLLYHAGIDALPGGLVGVDIFFVISGFVVSRSIIADLRGEAGHPLSRFYARRLRRIVPALTVALVTTTLAYCLFVPDAWLSDAVQRTGLAAFAGASNIVLSRDGDTYFAPIATLNPFTHTWSLGVEEQFYLIIPALLIAPRLMTSGRAIITLHIIIAALTLLSLIACILWSSDSPRIAFYSIMARFWELGIGVILSLTERRWRPVLTRMSSSAASVTILAGTAAVATCLCLPPGPRFPFPIAIPCNVATGVLIAIAVATPSIPALRPLRAAPILAIGRSSYSIYLWHWPVIVLFRWTIGMDSLSLRVAACIASIALGFASYRLVEIPTQASAAFRAKHPMRQVGWQILLLVAGAAISAALLLAKDHISLSRTSDREIWYPRTGSRHIGSPAKHDVTMSRQSIAGGTVRTFTPDDPIPKRMFMIGDSHSLPYLQTLRRLAEDEGMTAQSYYVPQCSFVPLNVPMGTSERCLAFYRRAVSDIVATGRRGDVVFLPSLRLPRFVDQWGPVHNDADRADLRKAATTEAIAFLKPIADRGMTILFESPTPVFRSVPFRCADWFNRMNPICAPGFRVDRAELDRLRARPLAQIHDIATALPDVRVWNAFDVLCPGSVCVAFRDGEPLVFDGDHLSAYGQSLLYPSLKTALLEGR